MTKMHHKSQENSKYITFYGLYTYILILLHIFIVFIAFYDMKLKICGSFINSTVIRCRHKYYLANNRLGIFVVVTSLENMATSNLQSQWKGISLDLMSLRLPERESFHSSILNP